MYRFALATLSVLVLSSRAAGDPGKFLRRGAQAIPGQYIVILDDVAGGRARVEATLAQLKGLYRFRTQTVWTDAVRGFTMTATPDEALRPGTWVTNRTGHIGYTW